MNPLALFSLQTILALLTTALLFALSLIHIYWGFGGLWPGKTKQDLIDKVFGKGTQFPSPFSCFFVATGLFLFSLLPWIWMFRFELKLTQQTLNLLPYLFYIVSGIFLLRGILGYFPFLTKHWKPIFVQYTKRIYNPLCIVLGLAFLLILYWF
ncbi:DUF3995 domain-containing protein [Leptospira yanagawae]|uniref:DUF3995 domain-containing protein n=1 Tax=Leptospira yanagawae TaxID=293069 RepID=UPI001FCFA23E|nr:DUF3995 domain-containing protein [Leptospira yanagawae]